MATFSVFDLIEYFNIEHDKIFVYPFGGGWSVPFAVQYFCNKCGCGVSGDWNHDTYGEGVPKVHALLKLHIEWHKSLAPTP